MRSLLSQGQHGLLELLEVNHAVHVAVVLQDERLHQLAVAFEVAAARTQDARELLPLDFPVAVEVEAVKNVPEVVVAGGVGLIETAGDELVVVELSVLVGVE
jgi:hypothetical protein